MYSYISAILYYSLVYIPFLGGGGLDASMGITPQILWDRGLKTCQTTHQWHAWSSSLLKMTDSQSLRIKKCIINIVGLGD